MKLNKKYEPQKKIINKNSVQADYLFPVILPSYVKISWKTLPQYLNQAIEWSIRSQKLGKNIIPCFLRNVDSIGDFSILNWKEQIPFPAKLQRLYTHKEKAYKKILPVFSQVFFQQHFDAIHKFLVSEKNVQNLLKLFEEKNLWKFKEELVYWDISTQTIVENDAIDWRKETQTQLVVKCFVETKNDIFPLVVDDPMLLFSDVAVMIHNNDKRYKKHLWKKLIIPVINKSIPILWSSDIDTIKNNGIQRLNPLLDQNTLEKVKELWLPTDEHYIDDSWCFGEQVANFWGKSIFDFTSNIIETLWTIGNLVSQEEVEQLVPYSKASGQRLIKKVVPMIILDFSSLQEEFLTWLETTFPDHIEKLNLKSYEILIETKNPYTQKIALLKNNDWRFESFNLKDYYSGDVFSSLILDQLKKGHLSKEFSIEELIDLFLLLPEEEWEDLSIQLWNTDEINTYRKNINLKSGEESVEELLWLLDHIDWITKQNNGKYLFNTKKLLGDKQLHTISCTDTFLQALSLLSISTSHFVFHVDELPSQTIINFFLFLFLLWGTECSIFPHEEDEKQAISLPERFPKLAETYGWESLRFFLSQQEKYEDRKIEDVFWYLKHLWNYFKVLYENWAFPENYPETAEVDWKSMFILWKWNNIKSKFETVSYRTKEYAEVIVSLKKFTREDFAWYFSLIKEDSNSMNFLLAGQIYMDILVHLKPIIPEFIAMVEQAFLRTVEAPLISKFYSETKDYKANILFDIFNGIQKSKEELWLRKHMPIEFFIQANPNMLDLVQSYEPSLKQLFNIREIQYFWTNENYPKIYKEFSILDMNLWVKSYEVSKKESSLDEWEREKKSKQQTADYLRSMLMSLSSSPLTPSEKIAEKQKELDEIMFDIQCLDIKIQKAKMEKKG